MSDKVNETQTTEPTEAQTTESSEPTTSAAATSDEATETTASEPASAIVHTTKIVRVAGQDFQVDVAADNEAIRQQLAAQGFTDVANAKMGLSQETRNFGGRIKKY